MTDLFNIPEALSPRLAWLKKHDVRTKHNPKHNRMENPWSAWLGSWELDKKGVHFTHSGATEDEAITKLAKSLTIPLWNEEGFKK